MALSIRRGATKVFVIGLDGCTGDDYLWDIFDKTVVRLRQGNYFVDKELTIMSSDATAGLVHFSEEETLPLASDRKALLQVASKKETDAHQLVLKSSEFEVVVLPSLWDSQLDNDNTYTSENLNLIDPIIPSASIHAVYELLHINIKEYSGIISEREEAVIEGEHLVYDQNSETLYSE